VYPLFYFRCSVCMSPACPTEDGESRRNVAELGPRPSLPRSDTAIHFIQIKPAEPVYTALPNTENLRTSEGPYS
jgi:hypothetical protein